METSFGLYVQHDTKDGQVTVVTCGGRRRHGVVLDLYNAGRQRAELGAWSAGCWCSWWHSCSVFWTRSRSLSHKQTDKQTNKQERGEERHTQTKQRYASLGRVGTSFTLSLQTFLQSVDFGDLEHEREVCATIHCRLVPFMHWAKKARGQECDKHVFMR